MGRLAPSPRRMPALTSRDGGLDVGRGAPAVCGRAEGWKGDTTFLLSTSVVVYCHAGMLSRCKIRGTVKAVAGFVMGSLDHPPGVSVNLKLVRDKMDKDTFQCGKKSLNYQTNASYLQIVKKEDEWTHLGVGLPPVELSSL